MWYKKSYDENAEGASNAFDMLDAFHDFYDSEIIENPKDAKGLAMFGGRVHYFHSCCHYHDLGFFSKHDCDRSSPPSPIPEFIHGDKNFAESLLENK